MSVFIAKELSEVLNTRLTIGKINIGLLNRIKLMKFIITTRAATKIKN